MGILSAKDDRNESFQNNQTFTYPATQWTFPAGKRAVDEVHGADQSCAAAPATPADGGKGCLNSSSFLPSC